MTDVHPDAPDANKDEGADQESEPGGQGDVGSGMTTSGNPGSNTDEAIAEAAPGSDRRLRIGAVVAIVAALVFGLWIVFGSGSEDAPAASGTAPPSAEASQTSPIPNKFGPAVVNAAAVKGAVAQAGHAVYWSGEQRSKVLELTISGEDVVTVRYLPATGTPTPGTGQYLTIASWPDENAWTQLGAAAKRSGGMSAKGKNGERYTTNSETPNNAYIAEKGVPVLGEAYDPTAGAAWELVLAGDVQQVKP